MFKARLFFSLFVFSSVYLLSGFWEALYYVLLSLLVSLILESLVHWWESIPEDEHGNWS